MEIACIACKSQDLAFISIAHNDELPSDCAEGVRSMWADMTRTVNCLK